jgi:hypothetical protein
MKAGRHEKNTGGNCNANTTPHLRQLPDILQPAFHFRLHFN